MKKDVSQTTRLFTVMDHMRRVWQNLRPCPDLTKAQFGTLMVLANGEKKPGPEDPHPCLPGRPVMSLSAVAAAMGQSLPSISQRISALEGMGYVERVPDPSDRRGSGIRISASGISLLEQAKQNKDQTCCQSRTNRETPEPSVKQKFLSVRTHQCRHRHPGRRKS